LDELGSSSCWQGVTTAIMGNCGYTLAPVARISAAGLVNLERAEDIPPDPGRGVPWTWSTFAEYLDGGRTAQGNQLRGLDRALGAAHQAMGSGRRQRRDRGRPAVMGAS